MHIHLNNCAYKVVDKQMIDYLDDSQELMNESDSAKSNNDTECMVHR